MNYTLPLFKARLTCNFKAVRAGQLSVEEEQEVIILSVQNGYATCQTKNMEVGQVPTYFLEMLECPGHTFADQIRYRRLWHTLVDGDKPSTSADLHHLNSNADVFIRELGQVPLLAGFAQILPNLGPLFPSNAPYVEKDFEDKKLREGDELHVECHIVSAYPLKLAWKGPNGVIKSDEQCVFIQEVRGTNNSILFSLKISNMQFKDEGQYILRAENRYGKCSSSANISIITPPLPPSQFKCKWTSSLEKENSIKLSWKQACLKGNAQNLWYTVEYKREEEPSTNFKQVIGGIQQSAIRISHLQSSTAYIFRVFSYNEAFRSAPSALLRVVPSEEEQLANMKESRDIVKLRYILQKQGVVLLGDPICKLFKMEHIIDKGRFSTVHKATCKVSGRHFAIKFFNNICPTSTSFNNSFLVPSYGKEGEWGDREELSGLNENKELSTDSLHYILNEIQVLKAVHGHPNLVAYFGTAVFNNQVVLILQKVNGPQVLTFLCQLGFVSEVIIQKLGHDLLSALDHLHHKGYAHLGIKPEDLLVECHNKLPHLILIDMGSCQFSHGLSVWQGGHLEFAAPEQLGHKPCVKSDIWSFGVLLFVLSTGVSPFEDENEEVIRLNILNANYPNKAMANNRFSDVLLLFMERIFVIAVTERPSAAECLRDDWMLQNASDELQQIDYIEDYVHRRRNRMRSSFLLHEL